MTTTDKLSDETVEYWANFGSAAPQAMARELLAHRRASQAATVPSDHLVIVGKASGMVETRVSLAARQIRQTLRDYGHRCAETSLPELIAADVDAAIRKQDEIHAPAPSGFGVYGEYAPITVGAGTVVKTPAPSDGLREALEPFAEFARASSFDKLPDDMPMTQGSRMARRQVTAGDFKRALAALSAPAQEGDAKPVCPICKGHSRFDQCSCHYEVKP